MRRQGHAFRCQALALPLVLLPLTDANTASRVWPAVIPSTIRACKATHGGRCGRGARGLGRCARAGRAGGMPDGVISRLAPGRCITCCQVRQAPSQPRRAEEGDNGGGKEGVSGVEGVGKSATGLASARGAREEAGAGVAPENRGWADTCRGTGTWCAPRARRRRRRRA